MKIEFKKVAYDDSFISLKKENILIEGKLKKLSHLLVEFKVSMSGRVETGCAICAERVDLDIDERLELKLCDGYFKNEDKDLDVIECFDGVIDFDHIIDSEIESIMYDYHYCNNCK